MSLKKLKKRFKKVRKEYHLDLLAILIIPVSTLIGILGQVSILSEYNAVVLFDWTQVFSDTAILMLPICFSVLGYIAHVFFESLKLKKGEKFRGSMFIFYFMFFFLLFLWLIKHVNVYLLSLCIFFIIGYISHFSVSFGSKGNEINKDKWKFTVPTLVLVLCLGLFIITRLFFHIGYGYLYKQTYVKVNNETYKIKYMNDKVIIYGTGYITSRDDNDVDVMINTSMKKF